jgi:hypothetical protein
MLCTFLSLEKKCYVLFFLEKKRTKRKRGCTFLFRKETYEKKSAPITERWRYAFALRQATLL